MRALRLSLEHSFIAFKRAEVSEDRARESTLASKNWQVSLSVMGALRRQHGSLER